MKKRVLSVKSCSVILMLCFCFSIFSGCSNMYSPKVSNEIWTNDDAVYVNIAPEYVKTVFNDWENSFASIGLKAVFITSKGLEGAYNTDYDPSLTLLLVLENGGKENQEAAIEILNNDQRVKSAKILGDVPFEPINTLSISEAQINARVGDTIVLQVSGYSSEYAPWFSFESLFPIVMKDYDKNKTYTPEDFPLSNASRVDAMNLGYADYLQLHLDDPGYFNAIKAVHAVAQNPNVLAVSLNFLSYPCASYSDNWFISDTSMAEILNFEPNGWDSEGIHTGGYDGNWASDERVAAEILCKTTGTFTVTFTQSLGWRMGGSATCTIIIE